MKRINLFPLLIYAVVLVSCRSPEAVSQQASTPQAIEVETRSDEYEYMADYFIKGERLSYNGQDIIKLKKRVRIEGMDRPVEVSFAALKKRGELIARFDGVYHSVGNATDFGLFPLLGQKRKQLVVSQTVPRGGRHWAVTLSPEPYVIFDSYKYRLGGENFPVIDINKDGVYEISMTVDSFWGFHTMSMAESPHPQVIFKYDDSVKNYVVANVPFQEYLLKGIDKQIEQLDPNDQGDYFSNRLRVLLRYVYAGKESEGWSFFDAAYLRSDREELKGKIKAVLIDEPVYKSIHGKAAT